METRFELFSKEVETNEFSAPVFEDFLYQCQMAINKLEGYEVPVDVEFWSWYEDGNDKTIWERLCRKEKILITNHDYYQIEFSFRKKVFAKWTPKALVEYGYCSEEDYNEFLSKLKTEFEEEINNRFTTHTWSVESFNGFLNQCKRAINKLEKRIVSTQYDFWSIIETGHSQTIWQRLKAGEPITINDGYYCIDFNYDGLIFAGWSDKAIKESEHFYQDQFYSFLDKKGIKPNQLYTPDKYESEYKTES